MDTGGDILNTSALSLPGEFDEQVDMLMQTVRLSRLEVDNFHQLFRDVEFSLSAAWPGCKVMPFGSLVTGLGIKTSDVDCYVSLPAHTTLPDQKYVFIARNLLRKQPIFQKLVTIANAKVPIVNFFHVPTQRYCDVNFKSPAGVRNSELIGHLLQMDRRALMLAVLIKYWSKVHQLTGTNLLPNYALTLLVIFFLQQLNILPPVLELQRSAGSHYVDYWNTAFNDIPFERYNNDSLYILLGEFFKFYSVFNFEDNIVSCFLGNPVPKKLFMKCVDVPDDFELYKMNVSRKLCRELKMDTLMCIQDPFEHSRNCSVAIHVKLWEKIKFCIQSGVQAFEQYPREAFLSVLLVTKPAHVQKKVKNKMKKQAQPHIPIAQGKVEKNVKQSKKKTTGNLHDIYNNLRKQKR